MRKTASFRGLFERARRNDRYWTEWLIGDFIDALVRRMEDMSLSRSALAAKLKTSPAYVTKVLSGDEANFTVRSMTKLARAANSVVRVHLAPLGSSTRWLDVINGSDNGNVAESSNHFIGIAYDNGKLSQQEAAVMGTNSSSSAAAAN